VKNISQQLSLNKSPKSPKTQSFKQVSDEKQVLAESKGCSVGSEIVIKRMNENTNTFLDKCEFEKSQQTENLKQICKSFEQTLGYHAFE
jgi:hypothetical protein